MEDVKFASVKELSRALAAKEVSAVELAQAYLDRMEAHKDLNCFLDVSGSDAGRSACRR